MQPRHARAVFCHWTVTGEALTFAGWRHGNDYGDSMHWTDERRLFSFEACLPPVPGVHHRGRHLLRHRPPPPPSTPVSPRRAGYRRISFAFLAGAGDLRAPTPHRPSARLHGLRGQRERGELDGVRGDGARAVVLPMSALSERFGRRTLMTTSLAVAVTVGLLGPLRPVDRRAGRAAAAQGAALAGLLGSRDGLSGGGGPPQGPDHGDRPLRGGQRRRDERPGPPAWVAQEWHGGSPSPRSGSSRWPARSPSGTPCAEALHARLAAAAVLALTVRDHLANPLLRRLYAIGALFMMVFGGVYTVIGYRLTEAPFSLPQGIIGSIFLVYLVGTVSASTAGQAGRPPGPARLPVPGGRHHDRRPAPLPRRLRRLARRSITAGFFRRPRAGVLVGQPHRQAGPRPGSALYQSAHGHRPARQHARRGRLPRGRWAGTAALGLVRVVLGVVPRSHRRSPTRPAPSPPRRRRTRASDALTDPGRSRLSGGTKPPRRQPARTGGSFMEFRLHRDDLAEAVAWAARTLPARSPVPVLADRRRRRSWTTGIGVRLRGGGEHRDRCRDGRIAILAPSPSRPGATTHCRSSPAIPRAVRRGHDTLRVGRRRTPCAPWPAQTQAPLDGVVQACCPRVGCTRSPGCRPTLVTCASGSTPRAAGCSAFEGGPMRTAARWRVAAAAWLAVLRRPAANGAGGARGAAEAVRRVAVVAEVQQHRLDFTGDCEGSVPPRAGYADDVASQRLPAALTGTAEITVAFNPAYRLDAATPSSSRGYAWSCWAGSGCC